MPCYRPKDAYRLHGVKTPNGKSVIVFSVDQAAGKCYERLQIGCGKCVGCLLDRSRDWALRCVHEAQFYENNCFITLTFSPESINSEGSLVKSDFVNFIKRLRKRVVWNEIGPLTIAQTRFLRYFHCGEYGSTGERPHHHALLFNFRPHDLEFWSMRNGVALYRSELLEECWSVEIQASDYVWYDPKNVWERHGKYYVKLGYVIVGDVTWESAAYCARYVLKKTFGKEKYEDIDKETGVVLDRIPEYCSMSNRPGIGRQWCEKWWSDLYPKNYMYHRGRRVRPPRYYDKVLEKLEPQTLERVKRERSKKARELMQQDPQRLRDSEKIKLRQIEKLERVYDDCKFI